MANRERLYERKLTKPLDARKKARLSEAVRQRLGSAVSKQEWHPTEPVLTVEASLLKLVISAENSRLLVDAEYGWAARLLITEANRAQARNLAHQICEEAGI